MLRLMRSPSPQEKDPFSEKVIARLESAGLTIRWRYGYKLANRYEVKRVCAGGMGIVYIVEDLLEKGKMYAAKTLKEYFRKPETEGEWERRRRSADDFLRECNIWVDLGKHRHIVEAEFLDKVEGVPLVMSEFIDGGGLDDLLESGPIDTTTALDFAIQACIGMEYANKRGVIVHRDIKPGNILVRKDGVAKVNDFGIAKAVESAEAISPEAGLRAAFDSASPYITRGTGTPGYMAPEQFSEDLLDYVGYPYESTIGREVDIYAFGLVLYEMITGIPAVEIRTDRETEILREASNVVSYFDLVSLFKDEERAMRYAKYFLKTLKVRPPSPSRNERLNAIIFKCLEKNPSDRYHSFTELREELMQIYREESGRDFYIVEEPAYEPNFRNRGKTYWVLGREKEAFESYEKALEQNPADILTWVERGLAFAEAGDLAEFGLSMEIAEYLKPSRATEVQRYEQEILDEPHVQPKDIRFLDRLSSKYVVPKRVYDLVLSSVKKEIADPFREQNPVLSQTFEKLKDKEASARAKAAEALGELGDRSAVPALIEALKDEDYHVRFYAAITLGKLGDRVSVPALTEALKDEDWGVPQAAAEALRKMGELSDHSFIPVLIEALMHKDFVVRRKAAEILGELGELVDRSFIPSLKKALKHKDVVVQANAAFLLGKLGEKSALPALIDALSKGEELVRMRAAEALGELGDRSTVPALIEALKDESHFVRKKAAIVLHKWGDRSAVQVLAKALTNENVEGRLKAVQALGELGELGYGSAVPALMSALKDKDYKVQLEAAIRLGRLGGKAATPILIKALNEADQRALDRYERLAIVSALGMLSDMMALSALINALFKDKDINVRREAAEALGKLGDNSAVPALIEALKKEQDYLVRGAVAEALAKLGKASCRSVIPVLIEVLEDKSCWADGKAAGPLRELNQKAKEGKLEDLFEPLKLYANYFSAREKAAEALAKLGDKSAIPALIETLKEQGGDQLRLTVAKAIGELGDGSNVPVLMEALSSFPDPWYVLVALRRLCSKPDKLSQMKEKLKEYSALEWNNRGSEVLAVEDYEGALKCFEKAVEIDPDWAVPKKGYDEAQHWIDEMNAEWTPKDIELHYEKVLMRRFDMTLSKNPRDVAALVGKGEALIRMNEYEEAIRCLDMALEIDPSNGDAQALKAEALMRLEEVERAHEATEKSDRKVPKNTQGEFTKKLDKGTFQTNLGKLEEVTPAYTEVEKAELKSAETWLREGTALFNLGKYAEAMECYDKVLEMDSECSDAWYMKGVILNQQDKYNEAIECFERAVKINPRNGLSWFNMGHAFFKLGKHEEAINCLDKFLDIDPKDADAWNNKGANLVMLSRYQDAVQCYDKALELNPRHAHAWVGRGMALRQLGKQKEARRCFSRALEIDPNMREYLNY